MTEQQIEDALIEKLVDLKYSYRPDIRDRATLERNFREKFEGLNRVRLTDAEFARLLGEIITPDVFTAAKTLRNINSFSRDDGTPLNYTLVNIKDWCKNDFEVSHQLRINTDYGHHRYDVILLVNGVPCVQIELKTLGVNPRRAMEQIVEYKGDPGNGYTKTLLCFMQLFIVSNRDRTYYFANNNARHFAFNADERFLPVYEFADEANKKITHLDDFAESFLKKCDLARTISRYMVLVVSEQKLMSMRPYQVLCRAAFGEVHRRGQRQRLHLAHHRQRQDADLLQGRHALERKRAHPQMRLRRGPQGPRPPDPRGVHIGPRRHGGVPAHGRPPGGPLPEGAREVHR